ncbi:hypothetical protein BDF21DRAFT_404956 [Thamnidium elegans]|nr:hypothetical protein BDF21DRAFT_404956 [Thamnidium elegans]
MVIMRGAKYLGEENANVYEYIKIQYKETSYLTLRISFKNPSTKARNCLKDRLNKKRSDNCHEEGHPNMFSTQCSQHKATHKYFTVQIINISLCRLKVVLFITRLSKNKRKNPNKKETYERQVEKYSGTRVRRQENNRAKPFASSSTTKVVHGVEVGARLREI